MKRWAWVIVVVVVLAATGGTIWLTQPTDAETSTDGIPPRPDDAIAMTVVSVWDGDTLRAVPDGEDATGEVRVRLIGIDTPERTPDEECWSLEARDALHELLPTGSTAWGAPDREPLDRYDRSLLYLWTDDGRFVSYELVAAGDAEAIRVRPNDTHFELLREAEGSARAAGVGRWSACPTG